MCIRAGALVATSVVASALIFSLGLPPVVTDAGWRVRREGDL
jgi:hypothetical protein